METTINTHTELFLSGNNLTVMTKAVGVGSGVGIDIVKDKRRINGREVIDGHLVVREKSKSLNLMTNAKEPIKKRIFDIDDDGNLIVIGEDASKFSIDDDGNLKYETE